MTECKHCGMPIVKYLRVDTDWDRIGDDDGWVHVEDQTNMTKHLAQPDWKTKS